MATYNVLMKNARRMVQRLGHVPTPSELVERSRTSMTMAQARKIHSELTAKQRPSKVGPRPESTASHTQQQKTTASYGK